MTINITAFKKEKMELKNNIIRKDETLELIQFPTIKILLVFKKKNKKITLRVKNF